MTNSFDYAWHVQWKPPRWQYVPLATSVEMRRLYRRLERAWWFAKSLEEQRKIEGHLAVAARIAGI